MPDLAPAAILAELISFLHEAGTLAVAMQNTAAREQKADHSIVTAADLAISALFKERFADHLGLPGHVLIDEETDQRPLEEVLKADYQWIIDPIDGTASYAGFSPFWGTIVAVLRGGRPWLAATYLPALGLLYLADDTAAHVVTHPFTAQESRRPLTHVDIPFTHESQICIHYDAARRLFGDKPCILIDTWGPLQSAMAAAGQVRGYICRSKLWDFAGGWVLAARAGYPLRRLRDGFIFDQLTPDMLTDTYRLQDDIFIGPDAAFNALQPFLKQS